MRAFFDLDDVILNTRDLLRDLERVFEEAGIPPEVFAGCYRKKGASVYSLAAHTSCMAEQSGVPTERLEKVARKLLARMHEYVFPDMLALLSEKGREIAILSFGGSEFQHAKVLHSGIGRHVAGVYVTEGAKDATLAKICAPEEAFIFVDDRSHHIETVKAAFPNAIAIFMQRPEGRYNDEVPRTADHRAAHGKDIARIMDDLRGDPSDPH